MDLEEQKQLEVTPLMNHEYALRVFQDTDNYIRFLDLFVTLHADFIQEVDRLRAESAHLRGIVHKVNGAATHLGLAKLCALCLIVERAIDLGEPYFDALDSLRRVYQETQKAIREYTIEHI